ncbi:hypothetical protein LguiA_021483 [Lonicera macranthoides]
MPHNAHTTSGSQHSSSKTEAENGHSYTKTTHPFVQKAMENEQFAVNNPCLTVTCSPVNVQVPIPLLSPIKSDSISEGKGSSASVFSTNSTHNTPSSSVESFVHCSLKKGKHSTIKSTTNSNSSFFKSTPTQSLNRTLHSAPYRPKFTRTRVSNKFSPLNELLDGEGDGEAWDLSSEDNSLDFNKEMPDNGGFFSPANSNHFIAMPDLLLLIQMKPWIRATWLMKNHFNHGKLGLMQNLKSNASSEFVPSPTQTRAQRLKKGTSVLLLHKQKKMSKAAKREANDLARLSKSTSGHHNHNHDPDDYQWKVLLADQQNRQKKMRSAVMQSQFLSTLFMLMKVGK